MTVKQFFKSTAFKCLAALLCVLLVSGIFLTIMNSLLAVTDEERFERAINKIYGKSVKTEALVAENFYSNAIIEEAYKIKDDGNYLIKSTGRGGYESGTVTCWVVVELTGANISGIGKVVIDSNKNQSYIDRVSEKALAQFGEIYYPGITYTADLITNATVTGTKTAICNSVNGAIFYVNAKLGNVSDDPYKDFEYTDNIETLLSSHEYTESDGTVNFTVVSKGYGHSANFTSEIVVNPDGTIKSFTIIKFGSTGSNFDEKAQANSEMFVGKDLEGILAILNGSTAYPGDNSGKFLVSGASESTYSLFTAALFATANYKECMPPVEEPEEGEEGEDGSEENEGGEVNE